jgi:cyanophycinase
MIGNGCVIAIGGNENKRAARGSILDTFVRRAGGADARIVIIPSASVEPRARAERYSRIFRFLGAGEVRPIHAELGVTDRDREALRRASGIFVTGGDQLRLMDVLRATNCVDPIREAVRHGAVYAGTSAGAAVVSRTMLAGSRGRSIELAEGLGLVPDVIVDQHFAERRRLPRLSVAAHASNLVGVGIDEDTAIVWNGTSGEVMVEGVGKVTIIDREHKLTVLSAP